MALRRFTVVGVCWLLLSAAAAEPPITVAVIPFGNLSEYRGRMLDRRAAAAVAAEAPSPWAPVDPAEVQQALESLAAPWPLETADLQRLCAQLPAVMAITGVVKQVQVHNQGALVSISLEVVEPLSGTTVGRVQGQGRVQTREPLALDVCVDQALQRAARAAWTALGPPPAVVGQVAGPPVGEVLSLKLAERVRLSPRAVLLLFPSGDDPVGLPVASAVVQGIAGTTAQARVLGSAAEVTVGAVAVLIGRLP